MFRLRNLGPPPLRPGARGARREPVKLGLGAKAECSYRREARKTPTFRGARSLQLTARPPRAGARAPRGKRSSRGCSPRTSAAPSAMR